MNIPIEMFIYILSFIDTKYDSFVNRKKCLCYTASSSFLKKCHTRTKYFVCSIHRDLSHLDMLTHLQKRNPSEQYLKKRELLREQEKRRHRQMPFALLGI